MSARVFVPVIPLVLAVLLSTPSGELLSAPTQAIAQMIKVEGKVDLKRDGQSIYRPVQINERLYHGDLLRVTKGSKGVIRCTSDSTTWTIPADGLPRGVSNTCSP